jgi:hypothetical protein
VRKGSVIIESLEEVKWKCKGKEIRSGRQNLASPVFLGKPPVNCPFFGGATGFFEMGREKDL